jgi:hypothetical protein
MSLSTRSFRLVRSLCWVSLAGASAGAIGAACAPLTVATQGTSFEGGVFDGGVDAAAIDGGGGGEAGGEVCMPGDVTTYHSMYHSADIQPMACASSPGLVSGFFDACLGSSASKADCDAFRDANPDCANCIVSPESAKYYGPIVDHGGFVTANVGGCIEVNVQNALDAGGAALGCAHDVQALEGCELAACEANCPVSDTASLAQFQSCSNSADDTGCSSFAAAAACTEPDAGDGVPAICLTSDFGAFYDEVVPLFCLPPPVQDAGMAAPPDGYPGD